MRLSDKQITCLAFLHGRAAATPHELASALETSPEGAAATASSLVRRGFVDRVRLERHVAYRLVAHS